MTRILMGSTYFFNNYPDFKSKDIDEIELIETDEFICKQLTGQGKCLFTFKILPTVDDYINYALKSNLGMVVGKFLIPEFNEKIGFTIQDLPKIQPLIDKLDDKHAYEKIIYESYLNNNAFYLTDEQRLLAYQSYKSTRL